MKRVLYVGSVVLFVLSLVACAYNQPTTKDISTGETVNTVGPTSESGINYTVAANAGLPVDKRYYKLTGTVVADVSSLTRMTSPGYGYITGYNGYTSGYYQPPTIGGKSFIRLQVDKINPADTDWVAAGEIVVVKGTDTKLTALLPGDKVDIECRRQAEAVAAIYPGEWFNPADATTWELDYCRMVSPVIKTK